MFTLRVDIVYTWCYENKPFRYYETEPFNCYCSRHMDITKMEQNSHKEVRMVVPSEVQYSIKNKK